MPTHRPKISDTIKERLRAEAGHKCANPGCPNLRTQIHHIREWAVYQTHDEQHMIAVCPTCHDAIHHGALEIDDDTLYRWKGIPRDSSFVRTHLYVAPSEQAILLLGTFCVTAPRAAIIFKLSKYQRLSFSIKDGEILLLDMAVSTTGGVEILRITDNYVRQEPRADVEFKKVPGTVELTVPCTDEFIPDWASRLMRAHEPSFGQNSKMTALSVSVVEPGVARIQGVWVQQDHGIVVTRERLSILLPDLREPISYVSAGGNSAPPAMFKLDAAFGVIDMPMFQFVSRKPPAKQG